MQLLLMNLYNGEMQPTTLANVQAEVGPGWSPLIARLIEDLERLGWDGNIYQVKEKFGGLRFYIGSGTDAIHKRITEAENESYSICERCGKPGTLYQTGWWKTLCPDCNNGRNTK